MSIRQLFFALCGSSLAVSAVVAGPYGSFDGHGFDRHGDTWRGAESRSSLDIGAGAGDVRPPAGLGAEAPSTAAFGSREQRGLAAHVGESAPELSPHASGGSFDKRPLDLRFGAQVALPNPAPATTPFGPNPNFVEAGHLRRQGCEKLPACVIEPDLTASAWLHYPWLVGDGAVVRRVQVEKRVSIRSVRQTRAVTAQDAAPTEARAFAPPREIATARDVRRAANNAPRTALKQEHRAPAPVASVAPTALTPPPIARAAPARARPQPSETPAPAPTVTVSAPPVRAYAQTLMLDGFISERH